MNDNDDQVFDELWRDWALKDELDSLDDRISPKQLETICRLWFGRGIMQGVAWSRGQIDKHLSPQEEVKLAAATRGESFRDEHWFDVKRAIKQS